MQQSRLAQPPFKEYRWFNSDSVQQELHCGVCRLELPVCIPIHRSVAQQDLWITAQVICYGIPVQGGLMSTSFALPDARTNSFVWNTLLNFQIKIKDLSVDATIVFTAWDPSEYAAYASPLACFIIYLASSLCLKSIFVEAVS